MGSDEVGLTGIGRDDAGITKLSSTGWASVTKYSVSAKQLVGTNLCYW